MKIAIKNVRLSFPCLWEARTVNGEGQPAFSASFLIDPSDPQVRAIEQAIEVVAHDKWGAKAGATLKQIRAQDRTPLHDGDLKATFAGFEGMLYLSARNASRPGVYDKDKTPLVRSDGKPYGGCYVNASLDLWAQDNNFGKRINASLLGVQFARDGDAFAGGAVASADDFEDLSVEEDALL